ncbi:uncharacterized protein LOC116439887 [Corvus moneduloides]|uniref:uncharacterized protein LOC116439887 n=1 Tax=Corvus moneduloides TaxID=1196302 RepID=UPI001362E68E|nr:uncharacterized protein LOC116439887 [Corvus moneduloides]
MQGLRDWIYLGLSRTAGRRGNVVPERSASFANNEPAFFCRKERSKRLAPGAETLGLQELQSAQSRLFPLLCPCPRAELGGAAAAWWRKRGTAAPDTAPRRCCRPVPAEPRGRAAASVAAERGKGKERERAGLGLSAEGRGEGRFGAPRDTAVHEWGHSYGKEWAPCGAVTARNDSAGGGAGFAGQQRRGRSATRAGSTRRARSESSRPRVALKEAARKGRRSSALSGRRKEHPELPPHPHGQQECLPQLLFWNGNGCWELWQDQKVEDKEDSQSLGSCVKKSLPGKKGKSQIRVSTKQNPLGAVKATGYFLGILKDWHPNATEGILAELEIAVAPSVEFLGNGKQQKQQEQSWKRAPAGNGTKIVRKNRNGTGFYVFLGGHNPVGRLREGSKA